MSAAPDAEALSAKLHRLHSLLFGSENALASEDSETALGLALRLLGFLESETKTAEDEAHIRKLLKVVHATIDTSRRGPGFDREAVEQNRSRETQLCFSTSSLNPQRIKSSKYFVPVIKTSLKESHGITSRNGPTVQSLPSTSAKADHVVPKLEHESRTERSFPTPHRGLTQSKITSYNGSACKPSGDQQLTNTKSPNDCSVPAVAGRTSSVPESQARATTSKSSSKQTTEIVDADFLPSPDEEGDEKSLWSTYAAGRKRGRNSYLNKKSQSKARTGPREDYSDEDYEERAPRLSYASKKKQELARLFLQKETESEDEIEDASSTFVTAKQKWAMESLSKRMPSVNQGGGSNTYQSGGHAWSTTRNGVAKSLGVRRGVRGNFVPPVRFNGSSNGGAAAATPRQQPGADNGPEDSTRKCLELLLGPDGELPERLRNLEPKLIEHVSNEIMEQDPKVRWDDIAGLEHAKKCVTEMVIWPLLRPDIFQGCRAPGKGLLLFGPPGTGKTMIGKAIAGEAKATFFSISASSLTSKWIGEGEKLVRALFGVASCRQPAVIFIDEVDSLLSQRKAEGEHESSRRLKTQFLIEMEGCGSGTEQILLIGATNRPQELDEAARRRLSKRLYIPLPSAEARAWIVRSLLKKDGLLTLSDDEVNAICASTDGYSGSDMKNLVKEASMGPLREALMEGKDISKISNDEMRSISLQDFMSALQQVRPSVSHNELGLYEDWNRQFGSLAL